MSHAKFTERLSVGITPAMDDLLEDIAISHTRKGKPVGKSDLIREAIRLYMDEQPDARGSRKQIAKSLEGQINDLSAQVSALSQQLEGVQRQLQEERELIIRLGRALQPVIERVTPRPK
ncbi:MAG: hypothetical protein DPW16_07085 [Chloroflexi bacterium]|nr:hypothetical protein [Chloroflexota bacterium]